MKYITFILAFFLSQNINAQQWLDVNQNELSKRSDLSKNVILEKNKYRTLKLNTASMEEVLLRAPKESPEKNHHSGGSLISLPTPEGNQEWYVIQESPIMEPGLAAKYPGIKTYSGYALNAPSKTVRLDWTENKGFHAMVMADDQTYFVDPLYNKDKEHYASYYKKAFASDYKPSFVCKNHGEANLSHLQERNHYARSSGNELRVYRIAIAATEEYTQFFNPQNPNVEEALEGIVVTMNRVNHIYEREVAVRMVLVANNDLIIYTGQDPYTSNSDFAMVEQNQDNLDAVIGRGNYDIGHVFVRNNGSGYAPGKACSSQKAKGVSGTQSPNGDFFDVDFVSHEIGHQFSANHSFNSPGVCNPAVFDDTAYEPGGGSTIMAYAGLCGADDIQQNSDAYFHTINFQEIYDFTHDAGNGCATIVQTGNSAPVADAGNAIYHIPASTPFVLRGSGVDADGDVLTYCWEEFDLDIDNRPPLFRSFLPITTPVRTFPSMPRIVNNNLYNFPESLPEGSRTMDFRLTVRDNQPGGGGVNFDQTTVEVEDTAPFFILQPAEIAQWNAGENFEITWEVSDTDLDPINCDFVSISMSLDGGYTYPIILDEVTENDGAENITIPNIPTNRARIKVEAVGNIFFTISGEDIQIIPLNNTPSMVSLLPEDNAENVAVDANLVITFDINMMKGNGEILIKKSSGEIVQSIDVNSGAVVVNAQMVTINLAEDLSDSGEDYYVEIPHTALLSAGGVPFGGIHDPEIWNFQTIDQVAPRVVYQFPAHQEETVGIYSLLNLEFDENINAGIGSVLIKKVEDDELVFSIDAADLAVVDRRVSIYLPERLDYNTSYYVQIASEVLVDLSGNEFEGILANEWVFSTQMEPLSIRGLTPANGSTQVAINTPLQIQFNQNITAQNGTITIRKYYGNQLVASILSNSDQVSVNGDRVDISHDDLEEDQVYCVQISGSAFKDENNRFFGGIESKEVWKFATGDVLTAVSGERQDEVVLYPNPTTGKISIKTQVGYWQNWNVQVCSGLGKILFEAQQPEELDLSSYAPGIYVVRFRKGDQELIRKIAKF